MVIYNNTGNFDSIFFYFICLNQTHTCERSRFVWCTARDTALVTVGKYWYSQGRFIESSTCLKYSLELTLRSLHLFFILSPEPYDFKFTNLIGVININRHSLVSRIVDVKLSKCIFSLDFGNYWEVSSVHPISLTFIFSFRLRNLPFVSI